MLRLSGFLCCVILVHYTFAQCPDTATQTAERVSHAVKLKFYRSQVDEWTSDGNSAKVAVLVSARATTVCGASASACGLSNCCSPAFKETDVGTESGYPKNELKDLELKIYIDIPTGNNVTGSPYCVLSKSVVASLVRLARDDIHTETGHWITYIDDDFLSLPPAKELNKIIIPLAFAIVIAIAGLTLGLNLWKKQKDADARRMKIIEDRKKHSKAKVQPTYHVDKTEPKIPPIIDGKTLFTKPQKPKRKDQLYKDKLRQSMKEAKSSGSEPYQRQGYAYERTNEMEMSTGATGHDGHLREPEKVPLTHLTPIQKETVPEAETPEKKKKKKKKRSKSKENMNVQENGGSDVQGMDNSAYGN